MHTDDRFQQVQEAAYFRWQARGCPIGSPETDWFAAESSPEPSSAIAAAEVIGGVLGSVAANLAHGLKILGVLPEN